MTISDLTIRLKSAGTDAEFRQALTDFCKTCETSVWYKFSSIAKVKENQERVKNVLGVLAYWGGLGNRDISFNNDTWEQTDSFKIINI